LFDLLCFYRANMSKNISSFYFDFTSFLIENEFIRSMIVSRCLKQIRDTYVVYDSSSHDSSLKWWYQTFWNKTTTIKKIHHRNSCWDNKIRDVSRKSICWTKSDELAHKFNERSFLQCKHCKKTLSHSTSRNFEINDMIRHLQRDKCTFQQSNSSQVTLDWNRAVN
jgi:hypothetical protein